MKKVLMTLIVSLAFCGSILAQTTHWPGFDYHDFEMNAGLIAQVQINGVFITETDDYGNFEVCPFVNGQQRGYDGFMDFTEGDPYPIVEMGIFYDRPGLEEITFKLFDHTGDGTLYEVCEASIENMLTGYDYGDYDEPVILNFISSTPATTFELPITAYTGERDHYYLIATPIGDVDVIAVDSIFKANCDLYYFDQTADSLEWINYNQGANNNPGFTQLEAGKGYLYASSEDVTLVFTGDAYDGEGLVPLDYVEGKVLFGWNLIGNPFGDPATLDKPYYRMNAERNALNTTTEDSEVAAMEGVFVKATELGQSATFVPQTRKDGRNAVAKTNIMVIGNEGEVMDNAIVRFDNGSTLDKFQIFPNSTKVYIPQDGKDYAIVNAGEMGEIPFCFKAETNGSYTLGFTNEEVTFSYLHLIDNLTGNDVDLLANPSYRFNAQTTDYANRFKLVFATGSSEDGDSFGFINGMGNLCIFGIEGTATLQVIDVTGRVLSSETFSGSIEKKLDVAPSVYLLRLINGNDVKVQKMVVK